jgi:hypothetical protein
MSTKLVLYTRRALLATGLVGLAACATACDGGVPPAEIEEIKDGSKGKAEAEARLKAFGTTGTPKSEQPKR